MYMISYDLMENKKPVFRLRINEIKVTCMYDTGASTAVWCGSKDLFNETFKEKDLQDSKFSIGGFGSERRVLVDIYRVDGFRLGEVEFPGFPIVAQFGRNFGCDLILGSSLATHSDITIRRIKERSISFEFEDFKYNSYLIVNKGDNTIIEDSYVLATE